MIFHDRQTVLVFGAHPDDIEVGMGGTVASLSRTTLVFPIIATITNLKPVRKKELKKAANILGAQNPIVLDINPYDLSPDRKLIRRLDNLMSKFIPHHVFTHWIGDSHQDHRSLSSAVISACRKNRASLFMYESMIPGGITHKVFRPQLYIDISPFLKQKISAIKAHKSRVKKYHGHWFEGITGRAQYRGYEIGVQYAESFEVIKLIEAVR